MSNMKSVRLNRDVHVTLAHNLVFKSELRRKWVDLYKELSDTAEAVRIAAVGTKKEQQERIKIVKHGLKYITSRISLGRHEESIEAEIIGILAPQDTELLINARGERHKVEFLDFDAVMQDQQKKQSYEIRHKIIPYMYTARRTVPMITEDNSVSGPYGRYYNFKTDEQLKAFDAWDKARHNMSAWGEEVNELANETSNAIMRFSTSKQLLDHWPHVEEELVAVLKRFNMLGERTDLVIPVDTLNTKLGLA